MKTLSIVLSKIQNLVSFCENLNEEFIKMKLTEKTGGYLTVMDRNTGVIVTTTIIGSVPLPKLEKYHGLSIEKAKRVFKENLSSSFQSRDPENRKWAGAIAGKEYIYSFSGHSEEIDEVICLVMCLDYERYLSPEFRSNTRLGEVSKPMDIILKKLDSSNLAGIQIAYNFAYKELFGKIEI